MGEVTWLGPVELDLETLRSFITVSAEESLARAAPLLFVSTSGLSRRIHELERQLGVELLERSTHGVILTPAGEQILVHAKKILQACDELFATARHVAVSSSSRRIVHLGICPGVENSTRDRVMAAVTEADAAAIVALDPDANMHLIRKLIIGELDLAILHQRPISPRNPQLPARRLKAHAGGPGAPPAPGLYRQPLAQRPDQPAVRDVICAQRRHAGLLRPAAVDL